MEVEQLMEALRVESLTKDYGGIRAVSDVSFRILRGERVALIGPNGAGKTTLFNLLCGMPVTSGKVFLFGKDVTHMAMFRRTHLGMGRSFQLNSLFPSLSVMDNLLLALLGTKPSRYQMFRSSYSYGKLLLKAEELLKTMGLWESKDEIVQFVSYGDQRKIEIALSLASNAKLLLLDEPSAGLTTAESADVLQIVRMLEEDVTVLFVAHDMDLVFGLAERIIVLHYGQRIADGTPEEIQADPDVRKIYIGAGSVE